MHIERNRPRARWCVVTLASLCLISSMLLVDVTATHARQNTADASAPSKQRTFSSPEEALKALETISHKEGVQDLSVKYLGRKGRVTLFLRNISTLPPEERAEAGKKGNQTKKALEKAFQTAMKKIENVSDDTEDAIDVSLPGRTPPVGALHPITQINMQICDIFVTLGFDVVEGPEIETDYYINYLVDEDIDYGTLIDEL